MLNLLSPAHWRLVLTGPYVKVFHEVKPKPVGYKNL